MARMDATEMVFGLVSPFGITCTASPLHFELQPENMHFRYHGIIPTLARADTHAWIVHH